MAPSLSLPAVLMPAIALSILAAGAWTYFHEPAARWRGEPAPADPIQTTADLPGPFAHEAFTITPLARYTTTAVVLARARYHMDQQAALAPVDLALGWGPMSGAEVINGLSISQSGRWYEYRWADEPPIDPGAIATHSANTHCLPAPRVRNKLLGVSRHDLVTLDGYLVEVTRPDGWSWTSSLSRDDTGGGSCEVFWVTQVKHRRP